MLCSLWWLNSYWNIVCYTLRYTATTSMRKQSGNVSNTDTKCTAHTIEWDHSLIRFLLFTHDSLMAFEEAHAQRILALRYTIHIHVALRLADGIVAPTSGTTYTEDTWLYLFIYKYPMWGAMSPFVICIWAVVSCFCMLTQKYTELWNYSKTLLIISNGIQGWFFICLHSLCHIDWLSSNEIHSVHICTVTFVNTGYIWLNCLVGLDRDKNLIKSHLPFI